jgi:hypothetical protein
MQSRQHFGSSRYHSRSLETLKRVRGSIAKCFGWVCGWPQGSNSKYRLRRHRNQKSESKPTGVGGNRLNDIESCSRWVLQRVQAEPVLRGIGKVRPWGLEFNLGQEASISQQGRFFMYPTDTDGFK